MWPDSAKEIRNRETPLSRASSIWLNLPAILRCFLMFIGLHFESGCIWQYLLPYVDNFRNITFAVYPCVTRVWENTKAAGSDVMTDQELTLEEILVREEIALGLRHADGSIPIGRRPPPIRSTKPERRAGLNPKTASYGEQLAEWLNASTSTAGHRRVCGIIDAIADVTESVTDDRYWLTSGVVGDRRFSGGIPNKAVTGDGEYTRRMLRLNKKLRPYRFSPCFHFPLQHGLFGSWEQLGKRGRRRQFHLSEYDAVQWLYEIATDSELERLRECRCGCGFWFFTKRFDQLFYQNHRENHHKKSPEFKKKRAAYMRNYNRREKERSDEALTEARRGLQSKPGANKSDLSRQATPALTTPTQQDSSDPLLRTRGRYLQTKLKQA
jgi:hypothetical protein